MRLREGFIPKLTYEVCIHSLDWYGGKFISYLYVGNDEPLSLDQIEVAVVAWLNSEFNRQAEAVLRFVVSEPIVL